MARYDLGLTWDEFGELTPTMFKALCHRRNVHMKHTRYANALTAAAVYNVHRPTQETEMLTAFDFVRDEKASRALMEVRTLKRQILEAVGQMPTNTPREKFMRLRENIISQITALGRTDAKELWAECWPSLTPNAEGL